MRLKRADVQFFGRLRTGLLAGTKVGGATFGAIAAMLALVFEPGLYVLGTAALPSVLVGFGWAWKKGKGTDIPARFLDELSPDQNYTCQPCTAANLRIATELVKPLFGRENIDADKIEQWRLKNPQGFMELVDSAGDLIACFVVVGLSKSFMQQFSEGRVTEKDITGDLVLDMRSTKKQSEIYIAGIMVKDPGGPAGSVRTHYLLWSMLIYLRHHFGLKIAKRFHAIPLTDMSERLLKKLGFSITSQANTRRDEHNFYSLNVDLEVWKKLLCHTGDLRAGCKMRYK